MLNTKSLRSYTKLLKFKYPKYLPASEFQTHSISKLNNLSIAMRPGHYNYTLLMNDAIVVGNVARARKIALSLFYK